MLCKTLGEQLLFQRIVRTWRIWDIKECGISESFSTLISPLPSPGYRTLMLVHPITTHDTGMWRYTLCFLASMTSFSNLNNSSNTDLAMKQWGVWTKNEIFLAYLSGIVVHAYTDIAQISLISPGLCVKEWENISLLCTRYIAASEFLCKGRFMYFITIQCKTGFANPCIQTIVQSLDVWRSQGAWCSSPLATKMLSLSPLQITIYWLPKSNGGPFPIYVVISYRNMN